VEFDSSQTHFPKIKIDPIEGLKVLQAINAIKSVKNQDWKVNAPIAEQMTEYLPTVSGNL